MGARENGVDIGIGSSSNVFYGPLGIKRSIWAHFHSDTTLFQPAMIPNFRSKAELETYIAQHGLPLEGMRVGSLVGRNEHLE